MAQAARRTAVAGLLLLCAACAGRLERHLLRHYFDVCAVADLAALGNAALVWLHPAEDGVVSRFEVVGIGPDERLPAASDPPAARLSLRDPFNEPDLSRATLVARTVRVNAEVHLEGTTVRRELAVTIARAETPAAVGRWIVVRLAPGGRTLRAASSGPPSGTAR